MFRTYIFSKSTRGPACLHAGHGRTAGWNLNMLMLNVLSVYFQDLFKFLSIAPQPESCLRPI